MLLVGILIYLTSIRLDISFAINMLSNFMSKPKELHWKEVKRISRYMHGKFGYGLVYRAIEDFRMIDFTYLYWEGCMGDRKSTSRYSFEMCSTIFASNIHKQFIFSRCTSKVEYKATTITSFNAVWLRKFLEDLHE